MGNNSEENSPTPTASNQLAKSRKSRIQARNHQRDAAEMNTVYLIHFAQPHFHARHYVGATTNLAARIATHRRSEGAKLLAHLNSIDLEWNIAAVWDTGDNWPFKHETVLKLQKNGPEYCPLCSKKPRRLRGAISYPIGLLPQSLFTPQRK